MLKRFVLLLLLVVMPFQVQVAWAVPSDYCQNEQGVAAHRTDHQLHQHYSVGKGQGDQSAGTDADCAYCHLGGAILPPAVPSIAAFTLPSINFFSFLKAMSSVPAREPERPKWTFSA